MQDWQGKTVGPFEVHERIGEGGYAVVYRATQASVGREVALKRLLPRPGHDEEARRRLQREAQVIAGLKHANLLTLHLFDWHEGEPYLVVEYAPGGTLRQFLDRSRPLEAGLALGMVAGIASGLDQAHAAGVVHRDVKPENVFLGKDGSPMLGDFGIAKLIGGDGSESSGYTDIGSPRYASPEQLKGGRIDWRSDLYSLASIAYELLVGTRPFKGETRAVLADQQCEGLAWPTASDAAGLSPAARRVFERALAYDPEHRFGSGAALVNDLRAALDVRIEPPQRGGRGHRDEDPTPPGVAATTGSSAPAGRRRAVFAVLALLVLVSAGVGAVVWRSGWLDDAPPIVARMRSGARELARGSSLDLVLELDAPAPRNLRFGCMIGGTALDADYELDGLVERELTIPVRERKGSVRVTAAATADAPSKTLEFRFVAPAGIVFHAEPITVSLQASQPPGLPPPPGSDPGVESTTVSRVEFEAKAESNDPEYRVKRGGAVSLRLVVEPPCAAPLIVRLSTTGDGTAGEDYQMSREVRFAARQGAALLDLRALGTHAGRTDKLVVIQIVEAAVVADENPPGAVVGARSKALVRIILGEPPGLPLEEFKSRVPEWPGPLSVSIHLDDSLSASRFEGVLRDAVMESIVRPLKQQIQALDGIDDVGVEASTPRRGSGNQAWPGSSQRAGGELAVVLDGRVEQPAAVASETGGRRYRANARLRATFHRRDSQFELPSVSRLGVSGTAYRDSDRGIPEAIADAATRLTEETVGQVKTWQEQRKKTGQRFQVVAVIDDEFAPMRRYFRDLIMTEMPGVQPGTLELLHEAQFLEADGKRILVRSDGSEVAEARTIAIQKGTQPLGWALNFKGSRNDLVAYVQSGLEEYLRSVHRDQQLFVDPIIGDERIVFRVRPQYAVRPEPVPVPDDPSRADEGPVFLVGLEFETGEIEPVGTAWLARRDLLGTNAHVAALHSTHSQRPGRMVAVRVDPKTGERVKIRIVEATLHPAYRALNRLHDEYRPLGVGNRLATPPHVSCDVGTLRIHPDDADLDLGKPFELASEDELRALERGQTVRVLGYPMEAAQPLTNAYRPAPTLAPGSLTSITDYYKKDTSVESKLLLQHSAPAVGGASGSPILNAEDRVVGLHFAGALAASSPQGERLWQHGYSYGQRVDLFRDLVDGRGNEQADGLVKRWKKELQARRKDAVRRIREAAGSHLDIEPESLRFVKWRAGRARRGSRLAPGAPFRPWAVDASDGRHATTELKAGRYVVAVVLEKSRTGSCGGRLIVESAKPIEIVPDPSRPEGLTWMRGIELARGSRATVELEFELGRERAAGGDLHGAPAKSGDRSEPVTYQVFFYAR
ncbi:MAG: protein kinase [Planctomycetota bacterium]